MQIHSSGWHCFLDILARWVRWGWAGGGLGEVLGSLAELVGRKKMGWEEEVRRSRPYWHGRGLGEGREGGWEEGGGIVEGKEGGVE